jgi:LPXTG-motif cell wall-anchored protein
MFKVGVQKEAARKLARVGVVLAILVATCGLSIGISNAAKDPCDDVWQGTTPGAPLGKTASPSTDVHPGDTVTYTFTWHSTGDSLASLEDCYRVDDGSNSTLNALVTSLYKATDITNQGANGDLQTWSYSITIPNDPSLVGHSIVNRAKMTHGSVESRTDLVSVPITCATDCGGGTTTGSTTGDTGGSSTGSSSTGSSSTGSSTGGDSTGSSTGSSSTGGSSTSSSTGSSSTGSSSTGSSTGGGTTGHVTSTTGSTSGSSTGDQVLGRVIHRKPKAKVKALATTGSETTALAWIGLAMLMIGITLRFNRFGREIFAVESGTASTDDIVSKAIRARSRDWTCRG